jgi:transposase
MLSLPPSIRIFVHALPTDMRRGFNGLSAIVSQAFGKNVLDGDYFVFVNKRLVDMLWGRRSERRSDSPDQMQLSFSGDPVEPPSAEQQEIIMAQAKADEATDLELLHRLEARRKARQEKQSRNEDFPPGIERRERVIDLPEEEKKGLKQIGEKVTERLRVTHGFTPAWTVLRRTTYFAGRSGIRTR